MTMVMNHCFFWLSLLWLGLLRRQTMGSIGLVVAEATVHADLPTKGVRRDTETDTATTSSSPPPHILFLLVDDLGWGDVGFHRQKEQTTPPPREIQTPHMDRLATKEGMILQRHYVHSSCTGTRTSLQSGRLPVHVQTSLKNPEDSSSGMPRNMTGLAEHLPNHRSHYVGKWDVGMATPKHTPHGRGYDTSLHYFEHKNDYWTQACMQSACCPYHGRASTTTTSNVTDNDDDNYDNNSPQHGSSWEGPVPEKFYNLSLTDLWDTHQPAKSLNGSDYEEWLFLNRMRAIIANHHNDDPEHPLFLFYAPHVAHCPLQVPQDYLDQFSFMDDDDYKDKHGGGDSSQCQAQTKNIVPSHQPQPPVSCRKQYHAMIKLLDDIIGILVQDLKDKGLWENTIMVLTSDNGGPTHMQESGSTNYDLRGGKYTDWEGGVRAAAFVSGGYVPKHRFGTIVTEPIHITDWYATLPAMAGNYDVYNNSPDHQEGYLPPVDAVDIWPLLEGTVDKSPRQEIPLSYDSLIQGDYKLIWKDQVTESGWSGPFYPNASSRSTDMDMTVNCSLGCLFDVAKDHGEHHELSQQMPVKLQAMKQRLIELRKDFFQNNDKGLDSCPPGIAMPCACWMAVNYYGGFLGPYQEVDIDHFGCKNESQHT